MTCVISRTYKFSKEDAELIQKELGTFRQIAKLLGYSCSYTHDILTGKIYAPAKFVYILSSHFELLKLHYCEVEKPVITL